MDKYIVLIAQNDNITTDMFDSDTPVVFEETNIDENSFDTNQNQDFNQDFSQNNNLNTTSEIPALPAVTPERPNEMQTVMEKSSISFGVLAAIIIFILLFAFLYKKFKPQKQYSYEAPEEDFKQNLETETHHNIQSHPKKKIGAKLNTPASIHQCIISFLEITKEV